MNEDFNAENSDVTEIAIEPEEAASPLDQLKEFDQSDSGGCLAVVLALFCLGLSLIATLILVEAVLGHGAKIPIVLVILICLVSVVVSLATIAPLRRWFLKTLNSPVGCRVTGAIRFLGGMLGLLCILLGFVLVLKSGRTVQGEQCLLLASWLTLALLMRFFPRGELK